MVGPAMTGGPKDESVLMTIGAVTTTSSDGLSSPPSADQMSASDRSCVSGWPTSMYTGRSASSREPPRLPGLSIGLRRKQSRSDDRRRCSSSGRCVHAVTR